MQNPALLHFTHPFSQTIRHLQAVLQHTANQKADLLFLRRCFFGKMGQLAHQRKDILLRMANIDAEQLRDGQRHEKLGELSTQLRENGREDYRCHIQLTAIMYEGVSLLLLCCRFLESAVAQFMCVLGRSARVGKPVMRGYAREVSQQ